MRRPISSAFFLLMNSRVIFSTSAMARESSPGLAAPSTSRACPPWGPSSAATMAVVNGPVRRELGMNAGTGAMGPYNQANATIGRAFGLLSQNLQGGSVPGETYIL